MKTTACKNEFTPECRLQTRLFTSAITQTYSLFCWPLVSYPDKSLVRTVPLRLSRRPHIFQRLCLIRLHYLLSHDQQLAHFTFSWVGTAHDFAVLSLSKKACIRRHIHCQICRQERRSGKHVAFALWDPFYWHFYLADSAGEPGWQLHNFFTLSSYLRLRLRVIRGRNQIKLFKYQRDVPRSATLWNNLFFFFNAIITITFSVYNVIRHDIYVIRAYTFLYVLSFKSHQVLGRHMTKPADGPAWQFQMHFHWYIFWTSLW